MDGNLVDLKGKRVLPGFIDAHLHPLYLANGAKQAACTPPLVHSIEDLIEQIRASDLFGWEVSLSKGCSSKYL